MYRSSHCCPWLVLVGAQNNSQCSVQLKGSLYPPHMGLGTRLGYSHSARQAEWSPTGTRAEARFFVVLLVRSILPNLSLHNVPHFISPLSLKVYKVVAKGIRESTVG